MANSKQIGLIEFTLQEVLKITLKEAAVVSDQHIRMYTRKWSKKFDFRADRISRVKRNRETHNKRLLR